MDKIDFVLPWVDGSDSAWIKQRNEYLGIKNDQTQDSRFRDWENLQYWFRGVEKFAPWVNHIYFVTWGHIPSWLNTDHPKLTVVKHEDYIPKQYLPTFSSHPIELNMHRIRGLSEQFVYFNDDTFIINKMEPEDFFRNGLPRDYCIETALVQDDINNPFACILMNNAALVNMHYSKREVIGRNWKKWFHPAYGKMVFRNMLMLPYREFSSFKYSHISSSFLKSTFEEVWREEGEVLDRVCRTRFRSRGDVNQYVMKYWQYMEGKYEPQSPKIGKFFTIGLHDRQIHDVLRNQKCKILCINDTENIGDFRQQKRNIKDSFESILPEKSAFELSYKDSGLLESFEHMGEGRTVYESLVNKFEYIQMEQLFFRAAFKNDQQNCLRDHDFELIQEFYTKQIESRTGRKISTELQFELEMYCLGSVYMTVQWVLGYRKCTPEELAHALTESMPVRLREVFQKLGLI